MSEANSKIKTMYLIFKAREMTSLSITKRNNLHQWCEKKLKLPNTIKENIKTTWPTFECILFLFALTSRKSLCQSNLAFSLLQSNSLIKAVKIKTTTIPRWGTATDKFGSSVN